MLRGTITDQDRTFTETWENIASSQNAIIRLDIRGDEKYEVIQGRRTFMITTEERLITQNKIENPALDPFLNGAFRPVVVPESVTIDSNPNALSDEEIRRLFASSDVAWDEWLKVIDSPDTLRRMLDLAEAADISLKRYKQVAARMSQVKPKTQIRSGDKQLESFLEAERGGGPRARQERGQGGRSQDYR